MEDLLIKFASSEAELSAKTEQQEKKKKDELIVAKAELNR